MSLEWSKHHPFRHLTVPGTNALKGVAIILVVLHNYFHQLPPRLGENEFYFDDNIFQAYIKEFASNPLHFFKYALAYFGHLGVQLFVFLSAYGLSRRYLGATALPLSKFLWRIRRFYFSFVLVVLILVIRDFISAQIGIRTADNSATNIILRLTLISNFVPNNALSIVGPWWFASFICQVYLILPLLMRLYERFGTRFVVATFVIHLFLQTVINPLLVQSGQNINFTVFGYLALLACGIHLAHVNSLPFRLTLVLVCTATLILAGRSQLAWCFSGIAFLVVSLAFRDLFFNGKSLSRRSIGFLIAIGGLSLHMFLLNGMMRRPFISIAVQNPKWYVEVLAGLAFLAVTIAAAYLLRSFEEQLRVRWRNWRVRLAS